MLQLVRPGLGMGLRLPSPLLRYAVFKLSMDLHVSFGGAVGVAGAAVVVGSACACKGLPFASKCSEQLKVGWQRACCTLACPRGGRTSRGAKATAFAPVA